MHVGEDDGVDRGRVAARRHQIFRHAPEIGPEQGRRAGVDQDEPIAGVDQPFIDRGLGDILGHEMPVEHRRDAGGIAREDLGFEPDPAIVQHRHLEGADFEPVDAGRLRPHQRRLGESRGRRGQNEAAECGEAETAAGHFEIGLHDVSSPMVHRPQSYAGDLEGRSRIGAPTAGSLNFLSSRSWRCTLPA